jgi:hypothetical protein
MGRMYPQGGLLSSASRPDWGDLKGELPDDTLSVHLRLGGSWLRQVSTWVASSGRTTVWGTPWLAWVSTGNGPAYHLVARDFLWSWGLTLKESEADRSVSSADWYQGTKLQAIVSVLFTLNICGMIEGGEFWCGHFKFEAFNSWRRETKFQMAHTNTISVRLDGF